VTACSERTRQQTTSTMKTLPTPDPALGLFETLLVRERAPVELDAHLARLGASLAAVFGTELPAGIAHEARERARELELGRLRIVIGPEPGAAAEIATEVVDPADVFPGPERAVALRCVRCDGGLGPHKWADRRGLDAGDDGTLPLLVDRGLEVLEASRANVFAVNRWRLYTPPADGRLLPGIARAGAIATAVEAGFAVEERRLGPADLRAADEVFLTGSVRGVEPARSLDGEPLPAIGEVGSKVAARLRRRWRADRLALAGLGS